MENGSFRSYLTAITSIKENQPVPEDGTTDTEDPDTLQGIQSFRPTLFLRAEGTEQKGNAKAEVVNGVARQINVTKHPLRSSCVDMRAMQRQAP
ncbi:hypothetical protein VNO77_19327 [Canavalia gladiata]|uniref:Uncharacterized protein n=1 Tax=Canavalia gladiata TaxID=3824 RepID=A0AAN9LMA5_CANGL